MSSRRSYEVVFRVQGLGKNGGMGPKKSFIAMLSRPSEAKKKMRQKNAIIISVKTAR